MSKETFYSELPTLKQFIDVTDFSNFESLPSDWYILVTDIINSTEAVAAGRYKEVNLIGASSIVAVLNVAGIEIPFVFGGDGASLAIPPSLLPKAKQALLATQRLAKKEFNLDLRIGAFLVTDIIMAGYKVKVAKLRVSENYSQGVFVGGGLTYATELIKDDVKGDIYQIKNTRLAPKADFSGLECRWQDIPSQHGEIISLLVSGTSPSRRQKNNIYREVIEQIQEIYGNDDDFHPIHPDYLNLSFNIKKLYMETRIRAKFGDWWHKVGYITQIQLENLIGWFLMHFKIKLEGMNWGLYKEIVYDATDYRKFDDMLRMVISGNATQREKLISFLEKRYREGKLLYGFHVSNRALLTCLVFERSGRQVHFVDGADGGYALAARSMKAKMNLSSSMLTRSS